jgi:ubiquinone/menaquinone biosynthesis C-methylase UbiE
MAGIKMGDAFLQLGCGDGLLLAALGTKVGLTGSACAIDESVDLTERAQKTTLKEGALVDVKKAPLNALPYPADTFDLVVVREHLSSMSPERRIGCLQEAFRVLRDGGGRCMVIEPAPRGGLAAILIKRNVSPHHSTAKATERALAAEGFKGIRRLAERAGTAFIEGIKPR